MVNLTVSNSAMVHGENKLLSFYMYLCQEWNVCVRFNIDYMHIDTVEYDPKCVTQRSIFSVIPTVHRILGFGAGILF